MTKEEIRAEWALRVFGEPVTVEEVRAEWKKRLLSGAYEQGKGKLCAVTNNGKEEHCCLGVLCEIGVEMGLLRVELHDNKKTFSDFADRWEEEGHCYSSSVALPTVIRQAAGVFSMNGNRRPSSSDTSWRASLSSHNDTGTSFAEIVEMLGTGDFYEIPSPEGAESAPVHENSL